MCRPVVDVEELDESFVLEEPVLNRFLVVQPESPLHTYHAHGVEERLDGNLTSRDECGAKQVPHQRVDAIEDGDDQRFFPPQRAMRAFADGVRHATRLPMRCVVQCLAVRQ